MTDYLISVKPKWANAFFADINRKTIELRKGNFGASLKPGDTIVIYSTMPEGCVIGTVKVMERYEYSVKDLWRKSEQGVLTHVSQSEFDAYYSGHHFGVGVWFWSPDKWERPISLPKLRQILGNRWQPPQQLARVDLNLLNQHRSFVNV
jgi:predicted transcriptional regulator